MTMQRPLLPLLSAFPAMVWLGAHTVAQCAPQWLPGDSFPGIDDTHAPVTTMWDADGAGPRPPLLVVAGRFTVAGSARANNIATHDPASGTWSALGSGTNGPVLALAALPNGDLVAAGSFTVAGGVAASQIARWDGNGWSALGSGVPAVGTGPGVWALTVLPNGDLVAGGSFATAGGVAAGNIARWDGSAWSGLGSGVNARVRALATLPNGDVVAGGEFTDASGVLTNRIARWNGASWSDLDSGTNSTVLALQALPNGDLVAGGYFTTAGGAPATGVALWDGISWSPLGSGLEAGAEALARLPNGDLVAGGYFATAGGVPANNIARWDGASWSALGSGMNFTVNDLTTLPNGDLVAGGGFSLAGGVYARKLARWNGANWSALAPGIDTSVLALATLQNGDLIAGGEFTTAGGIPVGRIARWSGSGWSALGAGLSYAGLNSSVRALAVLPNGDLIAGGRLLDIGGMLGYVARWDGAGWSRLDTGPSGGVNALAVLPNGDLVAAGVFGFAGSPSTGVAVANIARWNGSSWSAMGLGINGPVYTLAVLPNGHLVAGGGFTSAGGVSASNIARWAGSSWLTLGTGANGAVHALLPLPNGDIVAGGRFSSAGGVAASRIGRWNLTGWSALGSGIDAPIPSIVVTSLAMLPNGDVVAGGNFTGAAGLPANRIARWDGSSWAAFGDGTNGPVQALTMGQSALIAGGDFYTAGTHVSAYVARLEASCPAAVADAGAGCPGSGGANSYMAQNLPWIGSTFRGRSTSIPSLAFVATVTGFGATSVPLAGLLPPSPPACNLLVTPDAVDFRVAVGGTVDVAMPVPNGLALVGLTLFQQLVLLEVDQSLVFLENTSSNAISLTIGAF